MPIPIAIVAAGSMLLRAGAVVYNNFFAAAVTTAALNHATDNKLAEGMLKTGDALIGKDNMQSLGTGLKSGVEYVGEGLAGAAKTIDKHYDNETPAVIPLGKQGVQGVTLVGSAVLAEKAELFSSVIDKGIAYSGKPLKGSFSEVAAAPTGEPEIVLAGQMGAPKAVAPAPGQR